jgi:hypothetical protein
MNYLLPIFSVSEQNNSFRILEQKLETNSAALYFNALRQSPFPWIILVTPFNTSPCVLRVTFHIYFFRESLRKTVK